MGLQMKQVDFKNGSIRQNILQTAFPMLLAQVLSLLYSIVDRIYIGRIPDVGTEALGAVGLCFPVIIVITAFTNMFGMGGAPLFSMALGKRDKVSAGKILNTALRLQVIFGVLLTFFFEIFAAQILVFFGTDEEELVFALPYLQYYLPGTVFSMIATGLNPYINAEGYSLFGMLTVTIGALSNLALDPVFIFSFGLGVQGAAIATVISQILSAFFVLWFLRSPRNEFPIHFRKDEQGKWLPYGQRIASLGVAPFIMQITNSLVSVCANAVLMDYGGSIYVSAMATVNSVRQILDTPAMAITEGSSPTISYNYGAGRPERVKRAVYFMMALAVPYTAIVWGLILLDPGMFIQIFTQDPELISIAAPALHLYFQAFIFQSLQYSGQTVFKALNKRGRAIFFSLFRKVILVVPLTFLLPYLGFGTDGVFLAEPISNCIGGLACFITMRLSVWPELKRMETKTK